MLSRFDIENLRVTLGGGDRLAKDYGKARIYEVARVIIHPSYAFVNEPAHRTSYYRNDIALVKVDSEIIFDSSVIPICLPERGM